MHQSWSKQSGPPESGDQGAMAQCGPEQPKKFGNLRVKKDEGLENQKCYLNPK